MTALCSAAFAAGRQPKHTDTQRGIVLGALKCETISLPPPPHTHTHSHARLKQRQWMWICPRPHKCSKLSAKVFRFRIRIHIRYPFSSCDFSGSRFDSYTEIVGVLWQWFRVATNLSHWKLSQSLGLKAKVILWALDICFTQMTYTSCGQWLIGDECKWGKYIGPQKSVIIHECCLPSNDEWGNV